MSMFPVEVEVLSLLVQRPTEIKSFEQKQFVSEAGQSMFGFLNSMTLVNDRPLSQEVLQLRYRNHANADFSPDDIESLYRDSMLAETEPHMYETKLNEMRGVLFDEKHRQIILQKLNRASHYVKHDLWAEAETVIDNLNLREARKLTSTEEIIKSSVQNYTILPSNIKQFDKYYGGIRPRHIMTVFGHSSSMKTYITLHFMLSALKSNPDLRCCYFETELDRDSIGQRLMAMIEEHSVKEVFNKIQEGIYSKNNFDEHFEELMSNWRQVLTRLTIVLKEESDFTSISELRRIIKDRGASVYCIDFFQDLFKDGGTNQEANIWGQQLKQMTNGMNLFGLVAAQVKQHAPVLASDIDIKFGDALKNMSSLTFGIFNPQKHLGRQVVPKVKYKNSYLYLLPYKSRNEPETKPICFVKSFDESGFFAEPDHQEYNNMLYYLEKYYEYEEEKQQKRRG